MVVPSWPATPDALFLTVSLGLGTGNSLVVTLLMQLWAAAVTGLLNLRLPRLVG
ncbi:hypothetical protein [Streptomyces kaempferi]|uniref:Uncharacterized protein n=1 Tax=Streptomyces kaempferi TaxID=333725 RepID=A0ABW3XTX8_9ACTN